MAPGQEANSNLGKDFRFSITYCMLSVLIRITSMRRFKLHRTYNFMIKYENSLSICFLEQSEEFQKHV